MIIVYAILFMILLVSGYLVLVSWLALKVEDARNEQETQKEKDEK